MRSTLSNSPAARPGSLPAAGSLSRAALVLVLPALVAGCNPRNTYQAPPPPTVTVQQPEQRDVTEYVEFTGQLAPVKQVNFVARVQGFLASIDYQDGASVKQGATLFTIEPAPYKAQLDQAEANLSASKARALFASQQNDRYSTLARSDYASQMQAQQYKADHDAKESETAQVQAALEQARINYSYTKVVAPFDGVATNHLQSVGALVGTSETSQLATLVQLDPIWANFTVNEADVIRVRAAMAAQGKTPADLRKLPVDIAMQGESGFPHRGHLDYVAPAIDAATGTLAVRALLPNADRVLVPGAFVRVRIPGRQTKGALLVPDSALGNVQGATILLVANADNVVEQRPVEIGGKEGDLRIVRSGLSAQDRIIVGGAQQAAVGQTVAPREAATPKEPQAKP